MKPSHEEELGTAQDPLDRGIRCPHSSAYESVEYKNVRHADKVTHWYCPDCDSYFPLIGDTDRWIVYVNPLSDR